MQSILGGNRKLLVRGGTFGRFLSSGHLAYVNQGTICAVSFDPSALTTRSFFARWAMDHVRIERVRRLGDLRAAVPDGGAKQRISPSGGTVPRWSPNGRELLYRTDAQQLMVVTYKADAGSLTADVPRPWSRHVLAESGVLPNFDVAPDSERVVALLPATPAEERQSANHVTLMLGFFDDVRRRVPVQ